MYTATGINDKEQCLRDFAPLVKRLAHQLMTRLPYSVQIDDIIQAGMMGLLDAAGRYDNLHGAAVRNLCHPAHTRSDAGRVTSGRLAPA